MQAEVICTQCSLPYVVCNCTGFLNGGHCANCGASPEVILPGISIPGYLENEVISGASPGAPTLKGNSMLSKLRDAQTEAQQAITEINDKIEELQNAIYELERFDESISEVIDTIENLDGAEVSVDIDSYSFDLSIDL